MVTISFNSTNSGQKEADIQKACWNWLAEVRQVAKDEKGWLSLQDFSYMVPNGTQLGGSHKGRARYMASLKAQGFRSGVSDIVIAFPTLDRGAVSQCRFWMGAYIELKKEASAYGGPKAKAARKNAIRKEQREWIERMSRVGYYATVAWGLDDFKRQVGLFLNGESPEPMDWDDRVCDTGNAQ